MCPPATAVFTTQEGGAVNQIQKEHSLCIAERSQKAVYNERCLRPSHRREILRTLENSVPQTIVFRYKEIGR
jgi:hypothetical protein